MENEKETVPARIEKWQSRKQIKNEPKLRLYRYDFRLNKDEHIQFLKLMEQSGARSKTEFITNCIFNRPFQVVITDKSAMDICIKLSDTNAEIRQIGVNYNQVTKALKTAFVEKKALAFLYKLETHTKELIMCLNKIITITEKYREKWLPK